MRQLTNIGLNVVLVGILAAAGVAVAGGCGGSSHSAATTTVSTSRPGATTTKAAPTTTSSSNGPGALQAEANAAAAGDIPDNQVFLLFRNPAGRYSMKYPEGWAQQGSAGKVVFRDKNNIVRVVVRSAAPPSIASARSDLAAGSRLQSPPQKTTISGHPAVKVVYTTTSPPNAVTGKRVTLQVDRYYLWRGGHVAVIDLGTPKGVDNVDAYRLMIESFRWS